MPSLPTGTVTFLFTDIEGSTRLWEQHPEAMRTALARHDVIVRSAIETRGGYVFSTAGDAFSAAFQTAFSALGAALEVQRAIEDEEWGAVRLRVRLAMHTGEADERDGDYFGPALSRVGRLLEVTKGNQIIVSLATQQLIRGRMPEGTQLVDVGGRQLRDLTDREHVYQVTREAQRRRLPVLWMAAAGLGVVVLAVLGLAVLMASEPSPTASTSEPVASPTAPPAPADAALWTVELGGFIPEPLAVDDVIYVGSGPARGVVGGGGSLDFFRPAPVTLRALSVETGDQMWQLPPFESQTTSFALTADGPRLFADTAVETMEIAPTTGEVLWTFDACAATAPETQGEPGACILGAVGAVRGVLEVTDGLLLGSVSERLFGLDVSRSTPILLWHGPAPRGILRPGVGGNRFYVAVTNNHLAAFDIRSGAELWTAFVGEELPADYNSGITSLRVIKLERMTSQGLQTDDYLYLTDAEGFLTRRDPDTGAIHSDWIDAQTDRVREVESVSPPAWDPADPQTLYLFNRSGELLAVDAERGSELFRHDVGLRVLPQELELSLEAYQRTQPVVSSGVIYVIERSEVLFTVDVESGDVSTYTLPSLARPEYPPAAAPGLVVVSYTDGTLSALSTSR